MQFRNFRIQIILRLILIILTILVCFGIYTITNLWSIFILLLLILIFETFHLIKFVDMTNLELSKFLQSIKYSDFSVSFNKNYLGGTFKELNTAFQDVMQKFQEARAEKEENYRYLQTVIQHVGIGLISFNQNGEVEFINNAAKKILQLSNLKNIKALEKKHKNLSDTLFSIKAGNKMMLKITEENDLLQLFIYAAEFKMRDQNFKLIAMQNIQSELEEQEMEAWQKLIRVLTHEIMNSVTPISSLASTVNGLLNKYKSDKNPDIDSIEDITAAINTIQKRSDGLIHFVESYRNLTRVPKPNFQIVPVRNIFSRIVTLMDAEITAKGIKFIRSVNPPLLELTADPELIEQVLINLIVNSIHALENVESPEINLYSEMDERGRVIIKVTDNGVGISEDVQEKIFIPFFSTKKNGSGIGLSLSRQIMRSHGGLIRVNSIPGKETVFTLRF
jgi:two-component system nitrogen regulation sensor histidine kinase NtrY